MPGISPASARAPAGEYIDSTSETGQPVKGWVPFIRLLGGGGSTGTTTSANSQSVTPASDATFSTRYAPRNKAQSAVTSVGTTAVDLFPANPNRTKLIIQNLSTAADPLHINIGANATTAAGSIRVASGAIYEITGPVERVSAIATIAALAVTAWEF